MQFKNWLIKLLGLFTTVISVGLIYLILFKDGKLQSVSSTMVIEFLVVIFIALSTKFFWYTSTESSVRSSETYLSKRAHVVTQIETIITDAKDFDTYIEVENDANYNKYVSNKCKNVTLENYKMSVFDLLHQLFFKRPKQYYMVKYMLRVERRAAKQHKLSGANIRSLTQNTDGLTDDRNQANTKKFMFLFTGTIFSFISMLFTAAIVFNDKVDIDVQRALLKMAMYVSQIIFSILQSVLKARVTVSTEDINYFNKVLSILEKYESYKLKPYTVERISYIPLDTKLEVEHGSSDEYREEKINVDTSIRSDGKCHV